MTYEPRSYRRRVEPAGLVTFEVAIAETDLLIAARDVFTEDAERLVRETRAPLESYAREHPRFLTSFAPVPVEADAPEIVRAMAAAADATGVGPMAAVAGAVAERVARGLSLLSVDVIVENGGDIYVTGTHERHIAIWAGDGGMRGVGVRLAGEQLPLAVCCSSGTIGHSHSFGDADVAVVLGRDGARADAAATMLANRVRSAGDLKSAVQDALAIDGVVGAIAAIGDALAASGSVELAPLASGAG